MTACQNTNSNAAIVDTNEKPVQNEIYESEIILAQKETPLEFQSKRVVEENYVLDLAYRPTLEEVIPHSSAIVRATVNDVEYTSIAAHAWTVVDATVEDVLLGDVERAADINIYAYGGYISMKGIAGAENDRERYVGMTDEALENTIIHQEANMEESPLIGEQYIFFLCNPSVDMPIDAYGQYILGKPANGLGNRAIYQPAAS